jgi:hypothetical protein
VYLITLIQASRCFRQPHRYINRIRPLSVPGSDQLFDLYFQG